MTLIYLFIYLHFERGFKFYIVFQFSYFRWKNLNHRQFYPHFFLKKMMKLHSLRTPTWVSNLFYLFFSSHPFLLDIFVGDAPRRSRTHDLMIATTKV